MRMHIPVLAAIGAAVLIAGCGSSGGHAAAPASPAAATTAAAALHGAAAEQCAAFAPVYREITARMSGISPADDASVSEALGQSGSTWGRELASAAGPTGAATPASVDMQEAAATVDIATLDATTGASIVKTWALAAGSLRKAHLACAGQ